MSERQESLGGLGSWRRRKLPEWPEKYAEGPGGVAEIPENHRKDQENS
jgi:hypothetical protein